MRRGTGTAHIMSRRAVVPTPANAPVGKFFSKPLDVKRSKADCLRGPRDRGHVRCPPVHVVSQYEALAQVLAGEVPLQAGSRAHDSLGEATLSDKCTGHANNGCTRRPLFPLNPAACSMLQLPPQRACDSKPSIRIPSTTPHPVAFTNLEHLPTVHHLLDRPTRDQAICDHVPALPDAVCCMCTRACAGSGWGGAASATSVGGGRGDSKRGDKILRATPQHTKVLNSPRSTDWASTAGFQDGSRMMTLWTPDIQVGTPLCTAHIAAQLTWLGESHEMGEGQPRAQAQSMV
jgi:hypothetical protein